MYDPKSKSGGTGENGATFIPHIEQGDGKTILSWTNDKNLPNPDPVNIQGPPYVLTESDKQEIAQEVLLLLPIAEEVSF